MSHGTRNLAFTLAFAWLGASACAGAEETAQTDRDSGDAAAPAAEQGSQQALACEPSDRVPLEGRASPYDSVTIPVGAADAKICYGRPSLRGRTMIGGDAVPYGRLWRTGANEPTTIYLPVAAEIAGIRVQAGSYSIYTIPGQEQWVVIVNRSISQWGHESQYTEEVRAQELGRARVTAEDLRSPIETFTIRSEPGEDGATDLLLEWQDTRVHIPIVPV